MLSKAKSVFPGVWRAAAVGAGAAGLSLVVPVASVPLALLGGAFVPSLWLGSSSRAGLQFCSGSVLRAGVVCVGLKMSAAELALQGAVAAPCVLLSVACALRFVPPLARRLGLEPRLGQLLAVGAAICGVTAVSALAPAIRASQEETAIAVSNVVVWGAAGMLIYPHVAHWMFANSTQIGVFLGLAVHDTSQVMGAAATYAATYGNAAVLKAAAVTKLTRNLCLAGALPYLAARLPSEPGAPTGPKFTLQSVITGIPLFVKLFVAAAGVRTVGDLMFADSKLWRLWSDVVYLGSDLAPKVLLGLAMAAVGLQISPKAIAKAGIKPFVVGSLAALMVATTGLTAAMIVGVAMHQ